MKIGAVVGILLWISILALMTFANFLFRKKKKSLVSNEHTRWPEISILKPLCGVDEGLYNNLKTFFDLSYPGNFELIFCVQNPEDHCISIVQELRRKYPHVKAKLLMTRASVALNPKVANMLPGLRASQYAWIAISDSNVRVPQDYLTRAVQDLDEETGLLTAVVTGIEAQDVFGQCEALHLNSFLTRGMCLAEHFGATCAVGKSMLFHKKTLQRIGGLRSFGIYLAEDYMLGEAVKKLGLKVKLKSYPIEQYIGKYSLKQFWNRHVRWGRIRKAHAPLALVLEPIANSVVLSFFMAWSCSFLNITNFLTALLISLGSLFAIEMHTQFNLFKKININMFFVWILKEALLFPLWIYTITGSSVQWKGSRITVLPGGIIQDRPEEQLLEPVTEIIG